MTPMFLFPLDLDGVWALGGDVKTLILLKRRWFDAPDLSRLDQDWFPLQRVGVKKTTVLETIIQRNVQLTGFAKAEFDDLPENFWSTDRF